MVRDPIDSNRSEDSRAPGEIEALLEEVSRANPKVKEAIIATAVKSAEESGEAKDLVSKVMEVASLEAAKAGIATAVKSADNGEAQDLADQAMDAAPGKAQQAIADKYTPSQQTLDKVWENIVQTFKWVLLLATAGLIGIIILSTFATIEDSHIQIMLTVVTTMAGSLAGFITGQALSGLPRKGET